MKNKCLMSENGNFFTEKHIYNSNINIYFKYVNTKSPKQIFVGHTNIALARNSAGTRQSYTQPLHHRGSRKCLAKT